MEIISVTETKLGILHEVTEDFTGALEIVLNTFSEDKFRNFAPAHC